MASKSIFPEYLGPSERDDLQLQIEKIAEQLIDKNVQFLFGSGMSRPSKIPTGSELSRKLLDLIYPSNSTPSPAEVEELLCTFPFECIAEAAKGTEPTQKEKLRTLLNESIENSTGPHSGHKIIVNLCNKNFLKRIYTTNFDLLIERALGADRCKTITKENVWNLSKIESGEEPVIPVIHLHGTLTGDFIITEADIYYEKGEDWELLKDEFEKSLKYNVFVFVGYSMADPDFRQIYMEYQRGLKIRSSLKEKKTYVVNKHSDIHSYRLAKQVWDSRKATLLPLDAGDFLKELWDSVQLKGTKELKKKVASRLGIELDVFDAQINELKKSFGFTKDDAIHYLDIMTRGRERNESRN